MTAIRYTNDVLYSDVLRAAHVPESNQTFQIDDILTLADEEIQSGILPTMARLRQGYYETFVDLPLNAENVYDIPLRAAASGIVRAALVTGNTLVPIVQADTADLVAPDLTTKEGFSFIFRGSQIQVCGRPASGVLRLYYNQWPNKLVNPTQSAQITAINFGANEITVASLPTTYTTATPVDFIQDDCNFDWLAIDQLPTAIATTTLTFASLPARLQIGDWISLAGTSPVAQVPKNFRPVLIQRIVCRIYELQGYLSKLQLARQTLKEKQDAVEMLSAPRATQEPKRMSAWNNVGGRGTARRF